MATPALGKSMVSPEIKAQVLADKALEALAKACSSPVQFSYKALVSYHGFDSILPSYTVSFQQGDYLHIKEQYNDDWWIGRVVGHETGMGFIPSEVKLCGDAEESKEVYELAPIIRPIVFMGPTRKDSQLTQLLQRALVNFITDQFVGRLKTIKPEHNAATMTDRQAGVLRSEVHRAGSSLDLIFLDCEATFPSDLVRTNLHPMIVYVQITRRTVLQKLVKEMTRNSRERDTELQAAYSLYENPHLYSLILSDSNLDDACQNLELFLESYWAATRSVLLTSSHTHSSSHPPLTHSITAPSQ